MKCRMLWVSALFAVAAAAQTPSFEVASIRSIGPLDVQKVRSGQQKIGVQTDAAQVRISAMTLNDLILIAFRLKPYQVSGPDWLSSGLNSERFDIRATLPAGADKEKMPEMLQTLLAERFGLRYHRDTAEHTVYALVEAKGGHKMKPGDATVPSAGGEPGAKETSIPMAGGNVAISGNPTSGMVVRGAPGMGPMKITMNNGAMHMENPSMTMDQLVSILGRFVDRPIVDQTGLKGTWQVGFDLSMQEMMQAAQAMGAGPMMMARPAGAGAPEAADPAGSSIFQSIQQIGLKLESRKAPVERLVVDKLEKQPSEN